MEDIYTLEDGSPKSLISKNQSHTKNQKSHLKYLKTKSNKINGETKQSENPTPSSLSEAVKSSIDKSYRSKGILKLSSFKMIPVSKETVSNYKKKYKGLSHVRIGENVTGYIYIDEKDDVACFIIVETKSNKQKWIQALEVSKQYRGYKLSEQLLKVATNFFGANYLSVSKKNEIAIHLYEKNGFKEYESTDAMMFMKRANLIKEETLLEAVSQDKNPIFIVCVRTNTLASKVITVWTQSKYSHAAISFDTSMENLYSFNGYNGVRKLGGLSKESISGYIKDYDLSIINVKCLFVKHKDYKMIKDILDNFLRNQDKTTYGYKNIFNIFLNRAEDDSAESMSMVCSQFVTYLLHKANIKLVDKSDNLVTPADLSSINNPKVYNLFDGLCKDYNKKKIDRIFRKLKERSEFIKESNSQYCT